VTTKVETILMATTREEEYLRILNEHGRAIRRLAAVYEWNPAAREDLAQDIYLALWLALPRFRGDCSETTFVFRVAHNRAVSHVVRQRRSASGPLEGDDDLPAREIDPEQGASRNERRERLTRAVGSLPLGLRQVMVLTLEGLSQREIGDVLGIRENNVAVRVTRARKILRRLLESREDET
jgi:RNA polymerase sigma-70 factor (ECF subfamily)